MLVVPPAFRAPPLPDTAPPVASAVEVEPPVPEGGVVESDPEHALSTRPKEIPANRPFRLTERAIFAMDSPIH